MPTEDAALTLVAPCSMLLSFSSPRSQVLVCLQKTVVHHPGGGPSHLACRCRDAGGPVSGRAAEGASGPRGPCGTAESALPGVSMPSGGSQGRALLGLTMVSSYRVWCLVV